MATTFTRAEGKIRHGWSSELWFVSPDPGQNPRHVDFMWSVLDRTVGGHGGTWQPALPSRLPVGHISLLDLDDRRPISVGRVVVGAW
jgi:hypothetical protein